MYQDLAGSITIAVDTPNIIEERYDQIIKSPAVLDSLRDINDFQYSWNGIDYEKGKPFNLEIILKGDNMDLFYSCRFELIDSTWVRSEDSFDYRNK